MPEFYTISGYELRLVWLKGRQIMAVNTPQTNTRPTNRPVELTPAAIGGAILFGVLAGAVAGPPGAIIGTVLGGGIGEVLSRLSDQTLQTRRTRRRTTRRRTQSRKAYEELEARQNEQLQLLAEMTTIARLLEKTSSPDMGQEIARLHELANRLSAHRHEIDQALAEHLSAQHSGTSKQASP